MQAEITSFWDWQQHFADDKSCLQAIIKLRWPDGFDFPRCGYQKGWLLQIRHVYECAACHLHTSVTAGTLFRNTKLPLAKGFWSFYWVSSDKSSLLASRLTKLIGVSWLTAQRMLRKLRMAMGDQNNLYKLSGVIEFDDAVISGKRGRAFAQQTLAPGQTLHADALAALNALAEEHHHITKVTPPEMASEWLPWVHVVISNLKSYRLNRRFWQKHIPNRLLSLCATHEPVFFLQPATCSEPFSFTILNKPRLFSFSY